MRWFRLIAEKFPSFSALADTVTVALIDLSRFMLA